jgi:hypothetical protein
MNRRTIAIVPILTLALAAGMTACGSPDGGDGRDFASWQNTVNNICQEERVAWSAGLATALTGLFAVQFKPGFTPVPNYSRATDFASAITNLSAADAAYARTPTSDTAYTWTAAKTEMVRAADAFGAPNCVALADG